MINKKIVIFSIFLIALLSISFVSAEDSADSVLSVQDSNVLDESLENADISDENNNLASNSASDDSDLSASDDIDELNLASKDKETYESEDVNSDDVPDEIIVDNPPKNTLKSSYDYYPYNAYVDPLTTYYVSGDYVYFGWSGYFSGYFKVYKGSSVVFSEYLYGYGDDRKWCINSLGAGTYTAKLIDDDYGVLDSSKIVIKKATSKISVKSFTTRVGIKFHCYAYVKDKIDGSNIDGGYVKFKIAGKTYKVKLKNGVASFYFKVPKKVKKYACKASFLGGKNIKASSTKFTMKVKKPIKYKVISIGTKWDKYVSKKWGKYKVETYKFKTPSMSTLCMFFYKKGKMIEGTHYLTKFHYKYKGKWHWTKWRTGFGEAYYQKTAGIDRSVKIGKVKFKFRIS